MNNRSSNRLRGLLGAAAALAAIAVAVPAISAADATAADHHGDGTSGTIESFDADTGTLVITPDERRRRQRDGQRPHQDQLRARATTTTTTTQGDDGPNHDGGDDHGHDGPGHDGDDDHGGDHRSAKHGHSGRRGNCSPDDLTAGARSPRPISRSPERPRLRGGRAALSGRDAALGIPRSSPPGEPADASRAYYLV